MPEAADDNDPPPPALWEANLAVLRRRFPAVAAEVEAAEPVGLAWERTAGGGWTASRKTPAGRAALASRYDPAAEARKAAAPLDDPEVAAVVLIGLGLGPVVVEVLRRLNGGGVVLAVEPDPGQLAAVLRRVDAVGWLTDPGFTLLPAGVDRAGVSAALEPHAVAVTQGTRLIAHPLTRRLHAEAVHRIGADVAAVAAGARTNLATAMVHAQRTQRNLAENLAAYAAGATTEALKGAAAGRVGVCVAAGPSLAKNAHLLADPAVREKVVVIAAQTALRPLLDRGVEPDFVTALDHSAACARFYEDLPPLPGVTLVAEPTCHPVILAGFPGPVRLTRGEQAEAMLGPGPRPARTSIPPGATVAHLSVSLAAFLGCDRIVLVGQDLGFTDGLYYCPGTAVHRVWEAELSPWNTVEMMEWQRIARMRGSLERHAGVDGRPCLTDGQMSAYLQQFERDFARLTAAGVRVIDATEGGLAKAHAEVATLAETLEREVPAGSTRIVLPTPPSRSLDADALAALATRRGACRASVSTLAAVCGEGLAVLDRMAGLVGDPETLARENQKMQALQARVRGELADAHALVSRVNVTGAVRRQRADGRLRRAGATGDEKLRAQLARDRDNLDWLGQACAETLETLDRVVTEVAADSAASVVPAPSVRAA